MVTILLAFLIAAVVMSVLAVAACVVGGRADDQTARDDARERHYINLDGNYRHPRSIR